MNKSGWHSAASCTPDRNDFFHDGLQALILAAERILHQCDIHLGVGAATSMQRHIAGSRVILQKPDSRFQRCHLRASPRRCATTLSSPTRRAFSHVSYGRSPSRSYRAHAGRRINSAPCAESDRVVSAKSFGELPTGRNACGVREICSRSSGSLTRGANAFATVSRSCGGVPDGAISPRPEHFMSGNLKPGSAHRRHVGQRCPLVTEDRRAATGCRHGYRGSTRSRWRHADRHASR